MYDLDKILGAVCDEDSFLIFLDALAKDRADEVRKEAAEPSNPYGPGANGWQNGSIEAFLDAAAAWGEDWKGRMPMQQVEGATNPWKRCAKIIYMGKHYE